MNIRGKLNLEGFSDLMFKPDPDMIYFKKPDPDPT